MKKWSDILSYKHIVKRSDGKVYQNGKEISATIAEIEVENGMLKLRNITIDELLISPKAHTEEEIKAWYNSGAPFYDNESVQSAGTVLLNSEGITTEDAVGNKTTINAGQIKNENVNGDYSVLNEGSMNFYKAGYPNVPFKYLARTCQGISPSGTYVNLETGEAHYPDGTVVDMTTDPNYAGVVAVPWERKPVILPAISALKSYDPAFKDYVQNYECYVEQDQNGFYVYGRTIVPGSNYNTSSVNFTPSAYDSVESTQLLTPEVDVTKILIKFQLRRAYTATPGPTVYGNKSWIKIEYRRDGTSNWTNYGTFYSYANTRILTRTVTISGLSPGKYWVKCTLYKDSAPEDISGQYNGIATWVSWTRVNDTVISNGDVFWLAIENSID